MRKTRKVWEKCYRVGEDGLGSLFGQGITGKVPMLSNRITWKGNQRGNQRTRDSGESDGAGDDADDDAHQAPTTVQPSRSGKEPTRHEAAPGAELVPGGDGAAGEGSGHNEDLWFDNINNIFTMRYNADFDYIPRCKVSDVPDAVLECLSTADIQDHMAQYGEVGLVKLQAQLAFGSAMIGRELGRLGRERQELVKEAAVANNSWIKSYSRKKKQLLNEKAEVVKTALLLKIEEKMASLQLKVEGLKATVKASEQELESEQQVVASAKAQLKDLEGRFAREKILWDSEKVALKAEVKALRKQREEDAVVTKQVAQAAREEAVATLTAEVESLKSRIAEGAAAAASVVPAVDDDIVAALKAELELTTKKAAEEASVVESKLQLAREEAVVHYKTSDDFYADMGEYQELAMHVLRDALIKDGKVEPEVISLYTYESCMQRDIAGEFDVEENVNAFSKDE